MPPRARGDANVRGAGRGRGRPPRGRGGAPHDQGSQSHRSGSPASTQGSAGPPRSSPAPESNAPSRGGSARARGRGGGGGPPRGVAHASSPLTGSSPGILPSSEAPTSGIQGSVPSHVATIGVRRPGIGTAGRKIPIISNNFGITTPSDLIFHYDVVIDGTAEQRNPVRLNMEIITKLQNEVAPETFTPRVAYDGRKNIFSPKALAFGASAEFGVPIGVARAGKTTKMRNVRLTKVAEINPEVLSRYLQGQQSHDNDVLTAITSLNVIIRMAPSMRYPSNVRSFFTPRETRNIGNGIALWRGYFQSVRPAVGRMLVNIDISTAAMHLSGILLSVAMDILNTRDPKALYVGNLTDRDASKLSRQLNGVRVTSVVNKATAPRTVRQILTAENASKTFELTVEGKPPRTVTIARYFKETFNKDLSHPQGVLADLGRGALVPLELLNVPAGQIMKRSVPSDLTKKVVEFATKKPAERLRAILDGFDVLEYGQSEYMKSFGMQVNQQPFVLDARVLPPPTLRYGPGSRQPTIVPRDGAWNMVDKKFFSPTTVNAWAVIIYERQGRFPMKNAQDMINGLRHAARDVGVNGLDQEPILKWENGQGNIAAQLQSAGRDVKEKYKTLPTLLVCVLPEGATDIYIAIKHFGDITTGVATQCLKGSKCYGAKAQYFANVLLKVNVKLGGINTIPDGRSVPFLSDPQNPVVVLGADVIHPAPGSDGRPSFASMVGNVDGAASKYIATSRVQAPRQEIIEEMQEMVQHLLEMFRLYRTNVEKKTGVPKRVILYRDGVSEGQFKEVLESEIPKIKAAFATLEMNPPPKLTVVVVGKRHHVRFFPRNQSDADRSGNCPSGTIIDTNIVHPTDFDFYLQSHGGLLGTSRSAHYSVLYDENNFQVDQLQQLSFALCHVYARSTRAVSIPAPVYYADIVCSRARTHYDPSLQHQLQFSDDQMSSGTGGSSTQLQRFKDNFKPLHQQTARTMYFN